MAIFQVELYRGNEEWPTDSDIAAEGDLTLEQAVYGVQLAFDRGEADKAVIYIENDEGELISIITKSKSDYNTKEVTVEINQLLEESK